LTITLRCLESFKNVLESLKRLKDSRKQTKNRQKLQITPSKTTSNQFNGPKKQRNKTNPCAVKSKQKRPPAEVAAGFAHGFASLSAEGPENRRCTCRARSPPRCGRESRSRDASSAERSASASGSLARPSLPLAPMVNEECLEGANQLLGEKSSERLSQGDGVSET